GRGPDVHPRPLADRLESLEYLNLTGIVMLRRASVSGHFHLIPTDVFERIPVPNTYRKSKIPQPFKSSPKSSNFKQLAHQPPVDAGNRQLAGMRVQQPQNLRLQQRQLLHPGVRAHRHEQRAVTRDHLRCRDRGDLLTHDPFPRRDDACLLYPLRQAGLIQIIRQRIANGLRFSLARRCHHDSSEIPPATIRRRSSLVSPAGMSFARGTARMIWPRPSTQSSSRIRVVRRSSSSAKGSSSSTMGSLPVAARNVAPSSSRST